MESDTTAAPAKAPRIQVLAPRRSDFSGIRIAGYYWPTDPATVCELLDADTDGPHEGDLRRIGRKTYAALMHAMNVERRIMVIMDPGEEAAHSAQVIARMGADLSAAKAQIAGLEIKLADALRPVADLRAQAQADASTVAAAREEAEIMRRRADEATAKAEHVTKLQAQSEARAVAAEKRAADLEKRLGETGAKLDDAQRRARDARRPNVAG